MSWDLIEGDSRITFERYNLDKQILRETRNQLHLSITSNFETDTAACLIAKIFLSDYEYIRKSEPTRQPILKNQDTKPSFSSNCSFSRLFNDYNLQDCWNLDKKFCVSQRLPVDTVLAQTPRSSAVYSESVPANTTEAAFSAKEQEFYYFVKRELQQLYYAEQKNSFRQQINTDEQDLNEQCVLNEKSMLGSSKRAVSKEIHKFAQSCSKDLLLENTRNEDQPVALQNEKSERHRPVFSEGQREELKRIYCRKRFIGKHEAGILASKIGLTSKQVVCWFRNRRYSERQPTLMRAKK